MSLSRSIVRIPSSNKILEIFQRLSHPEKRSSSGLAGNINDLVGVREAVEAGSRALCVRAHVLKVQPIPHIQRLVEADALGDVIDAIACGSKDGVLGARWRRRRSDSAVHAAVACAEDLRDGVLVVEHDAGEVAVDPVVEVDHVAVIGPAWVGDCASRDDVACEREGGGDVVASWLGDDGDVRRDVLVEGFAQDGGHGFEVLA
ncbi:hypothetical protein V495_08480 [Pseudogymnoascus sp. VKM F-4514 (FW-929)]|nr:hypothetical protein V495_08480 [Pseudogymnoascus sp. VKM F-4514 (FW-929)]